MRHVSSIAPTPYLVNENRVEQTEWLWLGVLVEFGGFDFDFGDVDYVAGRGSAEGDALAD